MQGLATFLGSFVDLGFERRTPRSIRQGPVSLVTQCRQSSATLLRRVWHHGASRTRRLAADCTGRTTQGGNTASDWEMCTNKARVRWERGRYQFLGHLTFPFISIHLLYCRAQCYFILFLLSHECSQKVKNTQVFNLTSLGLCNSPLSLRQSFHFPATLPESVTGAHHSDRNPLKGGSDAAIWENDHLLEEGKSVEMSPESEFMDSKTLDYLSSHLHICIYRAPWSTLIRE